MNGKTCAPTFGRGFLFFGVSSSTFRAFLFPSFVLRAEKTKVDGRCGCEFARWSGTGQVAQASACAVPAPCRGTIPWPVYPACPEERWEMRRELRRHRAAPQPSSADKNQEWIININHKVVDGVE